MPSGIRTWLGSMMVDVSLVGILIRWLWDLRFASGLVDPGEIHVWVWRIKGGPRLSSGSRRDPRLFDGSRKSPRRGHEVGGPCLEGTIVMRTIQVPHQ
ncbi:unnamed protein product [Linum trigynum]|uniref:Uncharacterized protein n=1 Tax=Linum trigynum TaxID=586398 RepID=A0AAV2GPI1_9ROSI